MVSSPSIGTPTSARAQAIKRSDQFVSVVTPKWTHASDAEVTQRKAAAALAAAARSAASVGRRLVYRRRRSSARHVNGTVAPAGVAAPGRTEKCFTGEGDPFDTLGGTRRLLGGQCNCKSSKTAKSLKLGDPRTLHPVVGRYSVAAVHFYFGSECQ